MDKKRQKRAPKVYKSGTPGLKGRARLTQRLRALIIATNRFSKKAESSDRMWAYDTVQSLQSIVDQSDWLDRSSNGGD